MECPWSNESKKITTQLPLVDWKKNDSKICCFFGVLRKFFVNTNQLYIDNPDTALYNIVSSIFIGKYFNEKDVEVIGKKQYLIKDYLNFNKIEVAYSNDCFNIEYINLVLNKIDIQVDEINVKIINDDNFFDLSSSREYFEYDLRHDN